MSYIDLLPRIKNAKGAGKSFLKVPYSKENKAVAEILEKKGILKKVEVKGRRPRKIMKLYLNPKRPIEGFQFISKPSRRIYKGYRELQPVKSGRGILIVSTSKGIMSGNEARQKKLGGQVLLKVW